MRDAWISGGSADERFFANFNCIWERFAKIKSRANILMWAVYMTFNEGYRNFELRHGELLNWTLRINGEESQKRNQIQISIAWSFTVPLSSQFDIQFEAANSSLVWVESRICMRVRSGDRKSYLLRRRARVKSPRAVYQILPSSFCLARTSPLLVDVGRRRGAVCKLP